MRQRIDVDLDELDQIIDRSTHAPLSESEGQKLKTALHAMAEKLVRKRSTLQEHVTQRTVAGRRRLRWLMMSGCQFAFSAWARVGTFLSNYED